MLPRKPSFNKRAIMQLEHLDKLHRGRTPVQERWADLFSNLRTRLSILKDREALFKNKPDSLKKVRAEIKELEAIQEQARAAYPRKK